MMDYSMVSYRDTDTMVKKKYKIYFDRNKLKYIHLQICIYIYLQPSTTRKDIKRIFMYFLRLMRFPNFSFIGLFWRINK